MSAGLDGIIFDDTEWPQPGFQGFKVLSCILIEVEYLKKTVRFRDKDTKEH